MISSTSIRKSLESLLRNKMMEVHNENKKKYDEISEGRDGREGGDFDIDEAVYCLLGAPDL